MNKLKDLDPELQKQLQTVADSTNALLMSYIAPDSIVRKSPATYGYATIKIQDLYNIEREIETLREKGKLPNKIHLIVQTPGGELATTTKIAKYLQSVFRDQIEAFVPYEAASGGTLLCLAAKSIVMDATSNLTPIDPQVMYKNQRISATSYKQALNDFKKENGNLRPDEIPSPFQQMGNQFDSVIAKEMDKIAMDSIFVAYQLLKVSQKSDNESAEEKNRQLIGTVWSLANSDQPHSHVITAEEAKSIGLNVEQSTEQLKLLKLYKKWVSARLNEEQDNHIIEWFCPQKKNEKNHKSAK